MPWAVAVTGLGGGAAASGTEPGGGGVWPHSASGARWLSAAGLHVRLGFGGAAWAGSGPLGLCPPCGCALRKHTEGLSLQPLHRPGAGGAEEAVGAGEHWTQVGRPPCRGDGRLTGWHSRLEKDGAQASVLTRCVRVRMHGRSKVPPASGLTQQKRVLTVLGGRGLTRVGTDPPGVFWLRVLGIHTLCGTWAVSASRHALSCPVCPCLFL